MAFEFYKRRSPEHSILYKIVQENLLEFIAQCEQADRPMPDFVRAEFESFLECGILEHGFARVRCPDCGHNRVVAFSCKGRGICGSCIARQMSETAAYWVDALIPKVPMRQWVLTVPIPIRFMMAYDNEICSLVLNCFLMSAFDYLKQKAIKELGLTKDSVIKPGALTAIQRFSSGLSISPHIHSLITDGVFIKDEEGEIAFHALSAPSNAEVTHVAWTTCERVIKKLRKMGRWSDGDSTDSQSRFFEDEPGLAACYQGSIQGTLVLGPKAGQRVVRLYGAEASDVKQGDNIITPGYGFNLHAGIRIHENDRAGLERISRYLLRPPLSEDRLRILSTGNIRLRLKKAWSDGTSHLVFTPLDFMSKLAAIIPPPNANLIRYHGIFAPSSKYRNEVVAKAKEEYGEQQNGCNQAGGDEVHVRGRRLGWSKLLARIFQIDSLACPKCSGRMRIIAFLTEPVEARKFLQSIGLPADSPRPTAPKREASDE